MPGFNGTGPMGIGPLTGRGFGPCGRGFGWRYQYLSNEPVTLTKDEEKKILEAELKEIDLEKQEIEKRLKKIK